MCNSLQDSELDFEETGNIGSNAKIEEITAMDLHSFN